MKQYNLGREEVYQASSRIWSFKQVDDIVNGITLRVTNMAGGYPFECGGTVWADSERLYLCGEYSNDTEEHLGIQKELCSATSGYAAKRFYKAKHKKQVRSDFKEFRLQWMLFCVWTKCQGNEDFRKLLQSIPHDAILVENTTTDTGGTAEIWGCKNKELMDARKALADTLRAENAHLKKKALAHLINVETNKLNDIGTWRGQNNIGKILMICRDCLNQGTAPEIDYDLLNKAGIYLFGKRLQISAPTKEQQAFEHKIELMDGRVLECYPKEDEPTQAIDNELKLDTSGVFLTIGKKQVQQRQEDIDEQKRIDRRSFLDNMFLFIEHRERILSDSRMFLCPIPIQNGIAYTGTSGFRRPTLGVYIEWLLNCPNASMWNEETNEKWIVYHLAGSPLSGCNRCGLVNQQGETKVEQVGSFSSLWPKFKKINCRYDEAKVKYQAYNIREVLDIFEKEGKNVVYEKDIYLYFLERANQRLKNHIQKLTEYGNRIYKEFHQTLMLYKKEECRAFLAEYHTRKEQADKRLAEIQEIRLALRKRLKSGELNSKEYQKMWAPFGKERNQVKFETDDFVHNSLRQLFPETHISLWEIEDFIDSQDASTNEQD